VRYLDRLQPLALLVMRLALGVIIVAHGYHNLFGGLRHHVDLVAGLGLPRWSAYLSAISEFFGGLLVLLGLFTRVAAFAICIDLSVAIAKVNFHNGLLGNGGYEFPLALAALAFALIFFGGGPIAFTPDFPPPPQLFPTPGVRKRLQARSLTTQRSCRLWSP
jgi:putative oxidoreductase